MIARRTLPRTALAALAALALAVGGGALAWACTPGAQIDMNGADLGGPGSPVTVNGWKFNPGASVSVSFAGNSLGTVTASPSGAFTASGTVPNLAPGVYTVVASGGGGEAVASYRVTGAGNGPGPSPGGDPAGRPDRPGAPAAGSGGSDGAPTAPGSASGTTNGGESATGAGRGSGSVSGGERVGIGRRAVSPGSGAGLATVGSGQAVFADSVGAVGPEAGRGAGSAKSDPSERSASGDLWGGFGSSGSGARAGLDEAGVPANGPGSALTMSLALAGLGLTALMAGGGATALRRRRALARHSSD